MLLAPALIVRFDGRDIGLARALRHQLLAHADRARRILDVHHGTRVLRIDFHRRVRRRRGRPADQQRLLISQALHFLGDMHHFIQRGRDESRQPDEIRAFPRRGLEDFLAGHHDAQIDDFKVITLQHHTDDVLADVVHVALHGGDDDFAVGAAGAGFFLLDVGNQHGDRFFHHARRFHHLRQEHLARAK